MIPAPQPIDLSRTHVALILNPGSGRGEGARRLADLRTRLEPLAGRLTVLPVGRGAPIAQAVARAQAEGAGIVAVYGGDGSQSAAAGALAGSETALAVLPGGTFNYFARELGMETLDDAVDALTGGRLARLDLARVNGHAVLNNVSFGVYPEILERREAFYKQWGRSRLGAYWAVMRTLFDLRAPLVFDLQSRGTNRHVETPLIFAARNGLQLESLGLEGAQAVREGHFALFLARSTTRGGLVAASVRLALGRVRHDRDFELLVSDDLAIDTAKRRKLVAIDGEKIWLAAPFRLHVQPGALRVIVPAPRMPEERPQAA